MRSNTDPRPGVALCAARQPAYGVASEEVSALDPDARRFDDELLILLTDVARFVRTLADRRARNQGMTRAQWLILFRLRAAPGLTQRELAVLLEVEPITVGRLVDRLEARGLVERRADPTDRRVWRLHLTPAATPILAEIDTARGMFDEQATRGIDPSQRAAVVAVLLHMKANLQAVAAEDPAAAGEPID